MTLEISVADSTVEIAAWFGVAVAVGLGEIVAVGVAVAVELGAVFDGWMSNIGWSVGADAPATCTVVAVDAARQRIAPYVGAGGCVVASASAAVVAVGKGVGAGGSVGGGVLVNVGVLVASGASMSNCARVGETRTEGEAPAVRGALIALLAVPPSLMVISGMSTYMIAAARKMTSRAAAIAMSDGAN